MTQRERLLRLADLLDADPGDWPTDGGAPVQFRLTADWVRRAPDCGTVCCAAGLAALDPALAADGLGREAAAPGSQSDTLVATHPGTRRVEYGYRAAAAFFGASAPFDPESYPEAERADPKAVARRLRAYAEQVAP